MVMKKFIQKWLPSKRKIMQLYFALLFNANIQNFATGSINQDSTKIICAPGINCYSCPGAIGACPVGSLQASFSSTNHNSIYYVVGILLLYCVLFGRMICYGMCNFGVFIKGGIHIAVKGVKRIGSEPDARGDLHALIYGRTVGKRALVLGECPRGLFLGFLFQQAV